MSVFQANCPYCGTREVAFTILSSRRVPERVQFEYSWDTFATCGHCTRGILATFSTLSSENIQKLIDSHKRDQVTLETISPSPTSTGAPEDTPTKAANYYRQGMENLRNNYDAAGSMFRSALEAGLKEKFPDIDGSLYERIEKAANQQGLTPDLADWAHRIRLDGNDAVHGDEEFLKEDAERLHAFTELVFLYLFTLPGMLEKARGEQTDGG